MRTASMSRFEAAEALLTLGVTSTSDFEHDVEEPVTEQDGVATQTDITSACMDGTREELDGCCLVIRDLTTRLTKKVAFSETFFENDDMVKFYTGLPNLMVLKAVFAIVRIHVERVIGNVRQKYSILQSTLPIDFVTKRVGEDYPLSIVLFVFVVLL